MRIYKRRQNQDDLEETNHPLFMDFFVVKGNNFISYFIV